MNENRKYILATGFSLLAYFLLFHLISSSSDAISLKIWAVIAPILVAATLSILFFRRRQQEAKSLIDDLSMLNEISALMTQDRQVDELFKNAFVKIQQRLSSLSSAALFLVDEERQELSLAASIDLSARLSVSLKENPLKWGEGITGNVAKTGKSFFTDHFLEEPSVSPDRYRLLREEGFLLYGAVPLRSKNKTIGVFCFSSRLPGHFTPREQTWLEAVGNQIGLAIETVKLYEAQMKREGEALALFRLSQATTSSLTTDGVVKIIPDHVAEITDADAVWILLFDPDSERLEMVAARDAEPGALNLGFRPGEGTLGQVFQKGKIIFLPDIRKDHQLNYRDKGNDAITSMIGIPLIVKGKAIGVMALYSSVWANEGQMKQDRLDFLSTIASQVAIAIDNTKLYQDLEQKVTELKRLQGQLIQTEKLSAIGELVSGVAHEINNPLTSVVGFTQLLLETVENPRDREFLEKIFSEAMTCSEIIRNLLTFARKHPAEKSHNDVSEILRKALELKRYQLESDGIEVVERYAQDLPPAFIDPHQIQQVFFNIIHNAHQALAEKKRANELLRLTITSELKKGEVIISFQDTGPGILPDVLPKVFEPFFTTKEVGVGTGLGLSISYGIVKEHGGEISVENRLGEGVTFIVGLPLNGRGKERQPRGAPAGHSPFIGRKILIVDESASVQEMCAYILRGEGLQVEMVGKAKTALERLRTDRADLILIDLNMSDADGPAFYNAILKEVPVLSDKIIFSANDEPDDAILHFLNEKKLDFLIKPFSIVSLKEAVYRALTASLNA